MVRKYFLAVETSQEKGSLAVGKYQESPTKHEIISLKEWPSDGSVKASHSESLNQYCLDALNDIGLKLSDLHLLIVDIGPGSFTGVRVGINFVRTLSYILDIPVHPISSLAILASRQFLQNKTMAESLLPSLGTEFYYAKYEKINQTWREIDAPQLKINSEPIQNPLPWSVVDLVECAFSRSSSEYCPWKTLSPLYLRGSQAEEKMKRIKNT